MAEPSWLEQAREMRAETPRRTRREIANALGVPIAQVDYWMARNRKQKKPRSLRRKPRAAGPGLKRRMRRFKNGDHLRRCRNPDCERPFAPSNAHHAVYRQHIRAEGGDEWDPDDALNLCQRCHDLHHSGQRKLPLRALRQNNIDFAVDLFRSAHRAYRYLHTYYSGEDPKVERLLELEAA